MRMNRIQYAVVVMKNGLLAGTFALMLSACAAKGSANSSAGANTNAGANASAAKISSAHVQHVVFVTLANPSDAAAMKADSDAVLPKIPGVLNYACGPHIDVGRKNIRQDYTLGILVELSSVEAYRAYQANPEHIALIQKWKPKWSKSEMFDFGAP
jgi:hypothetical protein